MIIKSLNYIILGVYAGDNEFIFEGNKPVVLIGGMNGRGKTTFFGSCSTGIIWFQFFCIFRKQTEIIPTIFKIFC